MPGCNTCNTEFVDEIQQKLHFKSEWHRYNLKRKVAGVPGVTEPLFIARQSALAQENKSEETSMLYTCGLCDKSYRSSQAHAQHLKSKIHLSRAFLGTDDDCNDIAIVRPLPARIRKVDENPPSEDGAVDSEESEESEWEIVDQDEDMIDEATGSSIHIKMKEHSSKGPMGADGDNDVTLDELDPSNCFICDLEHKTIDACMVHMHKRHGFFIPDVEYLKDPRGLLIYLGLKVKREFICLYCNDRRQPFNSLEAVRKHMEAKSHCKVRYGDGGEDEEAELEEFYDYSSSYMDIDGNNMVAVNGSDDSAELGSGGSELIIRSKTTDGLSTKTLGSREFLRYYRQKPKPTAANDLVVSSILASRYKSMGLATVQSKEHMVRMKVMKAMSRSGVETMHAKIGMKSNVIRNLPNNVPY